MKKDFILFIGLALYFILLISTIPFYDKKYDIHFGWDFAIHYEIMKKYAKCPGIFCYIKDHCLGLLLPGAYPIGIYLLFKIIYLLTKSYVFSLYFITLLPIFLFFLGLYMIYREEFYKVFFISTLPLLFKYSLIGYGIFGFLDGIINQNYIIFLVPISYYIFKNKKIFIPILTFFLLIIRPFDSAILILSFFILELLEKKFDFEKILLILIGSLLSLPFYLPSLINSYRFSQTLIPGNFFSTFFSFLSSNNYMIFLIIPGLVYIFLKKKFNDFERFLIILILLSALAGSYKIVPFYNHLYRYIIISLFYSFFLLFKKGYDLFKSNVTISHIFIFIIFLFSLTELEKIQEIFYTKYFYTYYYIDQLKNFDIENSRILAVVSTTQWMFYIPHTLEAYLMKNNEEINCLYAENNPIYDSFIVDSRCFSYPVYWGRKFRYKKYGVYGLYNGYILSENLGLKNVLLIYPSKLHLIRNITDDFILEEINGKPLFSLLKNFVWVVGDKKDYQILIKNSIYNRNVRFVLVDEKEFYKNPEEFVKYSKYFLFLKEPKICLKNITGFSFNKNKCNYKIIRYLQDLEKYVKTKEIKLEGYINNTRIIVYSNETGIAMVRYQYWETENCYISDPFFFTCKVKPGENIFEIRYV